MKRTDTSTIRATAVRQNIALCHLSNGQLRFFTTLHMSANDHESTENIDFGVKINFSKEADSQIWNPYIMRINHVLLKLFK